MNTSRPLINFIGAGNLGKTLAKLFVMHQVADIQAICNRSLESAEKAVAFLGAGVACDDIQTLPPADIIFITTPDDQIAQCANALSQSSGLKQGAVVVHCSGVLTSEVLKGVKALGCYIASVHPMKSFANPEVSVLAFKNSYCAIEGDELAKRVMTPLFEAVSAKVYSIDVEKKATYHAAGVFASNYLVTLFEQAMNCLSDSGIDDVIAKNIAIDLMQSSLNNIKQASSSCDALTGPVKRGDVATIQKHLEVLDNKALYQALGLATVDMAGVSDSVREKLCGVFGLCQ